MILCLVVLPVDDVEGLYVVDAATDVMFMRMVEGRESN